MGDGSDTDAPSYPEPLPGTAQKLLKKNEKYDKLVAKCIKKGWAPSITPEVRQDINKLTEIIAKIKSIMSQIEQGKECAKALPYKGRIRQLKDRINPETIIEKRKRQAMTNNSVKKIKATVNGDFNEDVSIGGMPTLIEYNITLRINNGRIISHSEMAECLQDLIDRKTKDVS